MEQYGLQKAQAEAQYAVSEATARVNDAYNMVKFNALKYTEEEKRLDYEWMASRTIDNAVANLELNIDALKDQYVTSENLRAEQEEMGLGLTTDRAGLELNQIGGEMELAQLNTTNELKQILIRTQQNALAQNQVLVQQDREVKNLLSSISLDMQEESLRRDIETVGAMVEQGLVRSRATARTGGTSTGRALAQNVAKQLGRSYGQVKLAQQRRNASLDNMNAMMKSGSLELMQSAMQSQLLEAQAAYTGDRLKNTAGQLKTAAKRVGLDTNYAIDVFDRLTIPGFGLAAKQGQRELSSLQIQTQAVMEQAGMPYRSPIMLAPQKSIPGLRPIVTPPTLAQAPSTAGIIAGAVMDGAKAAMGGAYKTKSGGLAFM